MLSIIFFGVVLCLVVSIKTGDSSVGDVYTEIFNEPYDSIAEESSQPYYVGTNQEIPFSGSVDGFNGQFSEFQEPLYSNQDSLMDFEESETLPTLKTILPSDRIYEQFVEDKKAEEPFYELVDNASINHVDSFVSRFLQSSEPLYSSKDSAIGLDELESTSSIDSVYETPVFDDHIYESVYDKKLEVSSTLKKIVVDKTFEGKKLRNKLKKIKKKMSADSSQITEDQRMENTFTTIELEIFEQYAAEINLAIRNIKKDKKYKKSNFDQKLYVQSLVKELKKDVNEFTTSINGMDFQPSTKWYDVQKNDLVLKNDFYNLEQKLKMRKALSIENGKLGTSNLERQKLSNEIEDLLFAISRRQFFLYDFTTYLHKYKKSMFSYGEKDISDGFITQWTEKIKRFVAEVVQQL